MLNLAREYFKELNSEVEPENLIFGATHTHTSHTFGNPADNASGISAVVIIQEYMGDAEYEATAPIDDDDVMKPVESTRLVAKQVAIAADRAWCNRKGAY